MSPCPRPGEAFAGRSRVRMGGDAGGIPRGLLLAVLLGACGDPLHAQVISPRQLVEVVDISGPVVSPDGTLVAFRTEQASVERNTFDTVWYVQDTDAALPPRRVGEGGFPLHTTAGVSLPASATWSRDGRWIYYRALLDGRIDVWRAAVDGSGSEPLTRDAADALDFWLGDDGATLEYSVGASREDVLAAEEAEYERGIHIDGSVPIGQPLFRSGLTGGRLATQRLGENEITRYPLLAGAPRRWKVLDLRTGSKRELAAGDVPRSAMTAADLAGSLPRPWKLSHDVHSGRVALLTHASEWDGLGARPDVELSMLPGPGSRRPVPCRAEPCTGKAITGIQWRPGGDEVLFTVTAADGSQAQSIFSWNVGTGDVRPVVHADGLLSGSREPATACGVSADAMVCVAAEAERPPRVERIDLGTGRRETLFDPNARLAADMANVPVRLLRWKDTQGKEFVGRYFPATVADGDRPPLFVTYYRCSGFLRGGLGDEWPLATLATIGISALCINRAPTNLDAIERYEQARSAIESIVDILHSTGEIDRRKVGMGGLSFGTETTLWITMNSDVLSAASVSSPPVTPIGYTFMSLHGEEFLSRFRKVWQLGTPDETPERWRRLSPAFNSERIQAPVLMQLPEQEYLHALDYAIPLLLAQKADLYVYPNEPHLKFQPRHKLTAYQRNLDWFRFWLQGVEDDSPGKSDQYARWRLMRDELRREPGGGAGDRSTR